MESERKTEVPAAAATAAQTTQAMLAAAAEAEKAILAATQAKDTAEAATAAVEAATDEAATTTADVVAAVAKAKAAVDAATAAVEAAEARARTADSGEVETQRIEREKFEYLSARVKSVFHVPLVLILMLYPTVLGFCLAIRLGHFDLLMPTPQLDSTPAPSAALGSDKDLWRTDGTTNICLLVFTFTVVVAIHMPIAWAVLLRAPAGAACLERGVSLAVAIIFWAATSLYLFYFVSVARYGAKKGEWIGAGCTCFGILVATLLMFWVPWGTKEAVGGLAGAGAPAPAEV